METISMRAFILSLRTLFQIVFIIGTTVGLSFVTALIFSMFFDTHQLKINTDLISSVYQVLGTVYAILLTFTLWGVWQNFNVADASVQKEVYALLDLVHTVEASSDWKNINIRKAAYIYSNIVVKEEWPTLSTITNNFINTHESSHAASVPVIQAIQEIIPANAREVTLFDQALTQLNNWLDARRTRLLIARGNKANALWPLLILGAFVLFSFHGLFVATTMGIWITLLFGFSLIIGLTFYLIFTLDCPFSGGLSIDAEPFNLAINLLSKPAKEEKQTAKNINSEQKFTPGLTGKSSE
jgi:hypothetical protein